MEPRSLPVAMRDLAGKHGWQRGLGDSKTFWHGEELLGIERDVNENNLFLCS